MKKLLLNGTLLLACMACQSSERKPVSQQPAARLSVPKSAVSASSAVAKALVAVSISQPTDSLRAFLGVRPMSFSYVADSVRQGTPTIAGRFIVIHELFQTPRILYRSAADSTRWFQFKLEPVGEAGTVGGDFTVDTVSLDPRRQTLFLNLRGQNGFWGGSLAYGQTAIVDVTAEPLLLLKTEVLHEEGSYGRENDTVYNDSNASSKSQEQSVSIRNQRVAISLPMQTSQWGRGSKLVSAAMRPIPTSMLPAGYYRYRAGKLLRVKE